MTRIIHGTIRGTTVTLSEDPGIPDGQQVEVILRLTPEGAGMGSGFVRTEGALEKDSDWDGIMEEIQRARRQERRPQSEVL